MRAPLAFAACTSASPASSRRAPDVSIPTRRRGEPLRWHRRRHGSSQRRISAAGQGLPLHAHGSARPTELVRLPARGPMSRCACPPACITASTRRHDCRVEQVTYTSPETPGTSIRSPSAHREPVLQERARGHPLPLVADRAADHAGAGGGDPRGEHPTATSGCAAAPAVPRPNHHPVRRAHCKKGRRWAGSSTARPSSPSRRRASRCASGCGRGASSAWASRCSGSWLNFEQPVNDVAVITGTTHGIGRVTSRRTGDGRAHRGHAVP
jgi:hypothetical protein